MSEKRSESPDPIEKTNLEPKPIPKIEIKPEPIIYEEPDLIIQQDIPKKKPIKPFKIRPKSAYQNLPQPRDIRKHDSSTIAYRLIPRPDFTK